MSKQNVKYSVIVFLVVVGVALLLSQVVPVGASKNETAQEEAVSESRDFLRLNNASQMSSGKTHYDVIRQIRERNTPFTELEARRDREDIGGLDQLHAKVLEIQLAWGEGTRRNHLIVELFKDCSVPISELLGYIASLKDENLSLYASMGVVSRFEDPRLSSLDELANIENLLEREIGKNFSIGDCFSAYINSVGNPSLKKERLDEVLGRISLSELSPEKFREILRKISTGHSSEFAVQFLDSLEKCKIEPFEDSKVERAIFEGFTGQAALEILKVYNGQSKLSDEVRLRLSLSAIDFSSASILELLREDPDDNVLRAAILGNEIERGNFEEAQRLLEKSNLKKGNLSDYMSSQILSYESTLVSELTKRDPQGTISEIANQNSVYNSISLQTAFEQWIQDDSEAAAAWFENEGSNLSQSKRQYVAAAYAKEAAFQGNITLAKQWADLIIDQETAARIQEVIAGAENSELD